MIIDSHCHIDGERFEADREEVIQRAREADVRRMIVIGSGEGLADCHSALELVERYEGIWGTVGVHPHDARRADEETLATIDRLARRDDVVAIGETGLDYHYDHSPREVQQEVFRRFLRMARAHEMPVTLHIRSGHEDAIRILREEGPEGWRGVVHCFTGSRDDADAYLDMGLHLGLTGIVTFKNAGDVAVVAREVPLERLLVETDSPFMAPVPYRGKRNEPSYVTRVVARIAELRELDEDEVARQTTANTERLFGLPESDGAA